ncbi:MAG: AmmeMemoRadiSam system protein A [Acidobacteriota bacterium]|nr:AmmeMemoRadiSam system protein A [Acidobacteriota bacterium]
MLVVPTDGGPVLLAIARRAIHEAVFGRPEPPAPPDAWLRQIAATFVSLHRSEELRGCIGSIDSTRPIAEDVRYNAIASARDDPRFPAVEPAELASVEIEVSLLSEREAVPGSTEREILDNLVPTRDGVLLTHRHHRATFLPQVWKVLPDPQDFLTELKEKAGLSPNFWHRNLKIERYQVKTWQGPATPAEQE